MHRTRSGLTSLLALAIGLSTAAGAQEAAAQDSSDWNSARARELIDRAIGRRDADARSDSSLSSYQARAEGYVYFYLDRESSDERTLVKVDQIALEVFWRAPDHTKQRIIGMRDEDRLPNRMRYHLDHLTVVQDEFGDVIRLGEGDEVRAVPHPAAPDGPAHYDYRLADSLSLRLPTAPEPIRVYELEVRPRSLDRPAIIGSVFVDRGTAAIVRMTFTFTPASYVDPRLDYIRIALDNGLWDGRHWLPHEQTVEIRRQVPELDFPVGGVIRGRFRIRDYQFGTAVEEPVLGRSVVSVPQADRAGFAFEGGLYEGLDDTGLAEAHDLEALRTRAVEIAGARYLSGLPRLRLHLPGASSAARYNRAEGLFTGIGAAYALAESTELTASTGYRTGPGRLTAAGRLRWAAGERTRLGLRVYHDELRDLGDRPGSAGAVNTLFAALAGRDYLDPYYVSGAGMRIEQRGEGGWRRGLGLAFERHRSAEITAPAAPLGDRSFDRPVRAVTEAPLLVATAVVAREMPADRALGWGGGFTLEAGLREGRARYLRPLLDLATLWQSRDRDRDLRAEASLGAALGSEPVQRGFLVGGRGTLPGYGYRGFTGDRIARAGIEASQRLLGPWLRLRLLGAAGWTGGAAPPAGPGWSGSTTKGVRTSAGIGVGVFYDILRVDAVRGLDGGEWQLILSVDPALHDML